MGTAAELRGWLRQALAAAPTVIELDEKQLDRLRAQYAEEISEKLAQAGDEHVDGLLQQARESYLEQDRRAQRAESRATTLLSASSMLMGLIATLATLRFRSGDVPAHGHLLVGVSLALVLIPFLLAARYALEVTAAQHDWSRPENWQLLGSRAGLSQQDFRIQTLAALGAAAENNASIGDWKFRHLHLARQMFRLGLLMLVLHPLIRVALRPFGIDL